MTTSKPPRSLVSGGDASSPVRVAKADRTPHKGSQGGMMEPRRGLVLHLDPDVLENAGAVSKLYRLSCRVLGWHWFVCLLVDDSGYSVWAPLFSRTAGSRYEVPTGAKRGHPNWRQAATFVDPDQLWICSQEQVNDAATDDPRGFQNSLDTKVLDKRTNARATVALRSYLRAKEKQQ